ncbi:hypothetical protein B0H16DRAFT_1698563 [Mycena metata]|uniref:Uncharacterized protein n=1 Tax=Mycena metata TaxID=1033252 RepID=A0AAD7MNW7_9AGAR|nr:hypothetical protein B0H16DRAFT_1698563 [Mycena metata]
MPAALLVVVCGTHAALRGTLKCIKPVFIPLVQLHHRLSTVKPIKPRFNHGSTFLLFNVDRLLLTDNSPRIVAIFENLNNFQAQTGLDPASESLTTGAPPPLRLFQCAATQPPCGKVPTAAAALFFLVTEDFFSTGNIGNVAPGRGGFSVIVGLRIHTSSGIELTVVGNGESTPAPFFLPFNDRQLFCETEVSMRQYGSTKAQFEALSRIQAFIQIVCGREGKRPFGVERQLSHPIVIYGEQGTKGAGGHLPMQQRFSCGNVEQSRGNVGSGSGSLQHLKRQSGTFPLPKSMLQAYLKRLQSAARRTSISSPGNSVSPFAGNDGSPSIERNLGKRQNNYQWEVFQQLDPMYMTGTLEGTTPPHGIAQLAVGSGPTASAAREGNEHDKCVQDATIIAVAVLEPPKMIRVIC